MDKKKGDIDPSELVGGILNIFGLKIDLAEALSSQEGFRSRLEELRERLIAAGGKETLSDLEWKRGAVKVTGHLRTRGILGDQEFHIGTMGKRHEEGEQPSAGQPEQASEPPVDILDEGKLVRIVADVPGVSLDDLALDVGKRRVTISTRDTSRRSYRKELRLDTEVDPASMRASCRNGVLEVYLRKKGEKATRRKRK